MPRPREHVNELPRLVKVIQQTHEAGEAATREGREIYRKGLVGYHTCGKAAPEGQGASGAREFAALAEGELSEGQRPAVPRYMALAKLDVTSDLEEEWRIICGNAPANTEEDSPNTQESEGGTHKGDGGKHRKEAPSGDDKKAKKDKPRPNLADEGSWTIPLKTTEEERDEIHRMLEELQKAWNETDVTATVLHAIRCRVPGRKTSREKASGARASRAKA